MPTDAAVDDELHRLRRSGLSLHRNEAGPRRGGWSVSKPAAVPGNSVPGYECWYGDEMPDAPGVELFTEAGRWHTEVHEWVPGPGPGDFRHEHDGPGDAVDRVLDYYFGPPDRMYPEELRRIREAR